MAKPQYFGTDGIRGTAGTAPMSAEFVLKLGRAAGLVLGGEITRRPTFVVGRDTRSSGLMLQSALVAGLLASGADVVDLGVLPTPAIAFLTQKTGAQAGVVISASHNPAAENGIKFLSSQGTKLPEEIELEIEALLQAEQIPANGYGFGQIDDGAYLHEVYLQDLAESQSGLDLHGLKLLLDCANGAAYQVGPEIFRRLGAEVIALNASPDGQNINAQAGSEYVRSYPHDFAACVREHNADLGLAFDGDADRVILMDERGRLVDGDYMLAILADYLRTQDKLLRSTIVTTTMANGALNGFCQQRKLALIETPVGDKYITEKLFNLSQEDGTQGKLGLGGEQSGHVILFDVAHHTGDGLRTALFMLQVLRAHPGTKFSALTDGIQKFPQVVASCTVAAKPDLKTIQPLEALLAELRQALPGLVRQNLRYSGTEPKFRLMLEADTRHTTAEVASYAWKVCELIQHETGTPADAPIEVLNVAEGGLVPRSAEA
jgi:phosphoglucosamine mutase